MDTSTQERDIVKQVIQRYAQFKPSHGDIRLDTVFDDTQNRYASGGDQAATAAGL